MGHQASHGRQPLLLQIYPVKQAKEQHPIEETALPACQPKEGGRGEPCFLGASLPSCHRGALSGMGEERFQAAGRKIQLVLQQGKHGPQIGGLRQTILPAPFQGLQNGDADPGALGQISKT
jgi:hypothetical protein